MAVCVVGFAGLFCVIVGGEGVAHLVSTFGRQETPAERESAAGLCRMRMQTIRNAIEFYMYDTGEVPLLLEHLVRAPQGSENWNGPYVRRGLVRDDPWGRSFRYEIANDGFYLTSAGRDRIFDLGELAGLDASERDRRLIMAGIPVPPPDDYDPEYDNIEVFHYHPRMSEMVDPDVITRLHRVGDRFLLDAEDDEIADVLDTATGVPNATTND